MVRFSDMLGGSGEPDDAHATKSVYAALSDDRDPDNEPEDDEDDEETSVAGADEPATEAAPAAERAPAPTFESPEDVLDRLTQYASSARAAEPVMPPDEDAGGVDAPGEDARGVDRPDDEPLPPVGDDFLPRAKEIERKPGRSRKRRP